jgi:prepilin-type N-terminal cleavage/methylation domain-containing protein
MLRARRSAGFSLVELMIVVAIIGILGSIGSVALSRYIKKSRTAEAAGHLSKMWAGSLAYYEADHTSSTGAMLPKQFPGTCAASLESDCCTQPGGKCAGNAAVYRNATFVALGFNIPDPHLYRAIYWACPSAATNMWAEAWGDLDCDGTTARFVRKADVQANGDILGYPVVAPINPLE